MHVILTLANGDNYRLDMIEFNPELLGQWLYQIFKSIKNHSPGMRYQLEFY